MVGFAGMLLTGTSSNFGYLLVLVVAWIATRHGAIGGALAALFTNLGAISAYVWIGSQPYPPLEIQVLFAAMAVTGLLIGASFDERTALARDRAEKEQALARIARTRAVGEIGAAISHELNTALQTLSIHLGIARSRAEPGKNSDSDRESLIRSLEKAQATLESAADYQSRIRSFLRGQTTETEVLDLREVVDSALQIYGPVAQRAGIKIRFRRPSASLPVRGHGVEFQHVLVNLLDNARGAIQSAPDSGREGKGRINITLTPSTAGRCRLVLEDSGPGFEDQALENALTSFFTTKEDGMGMGLAISKSIVTAHGGTIHLSNVEGGTHGARVTIDFPSAENGNDRT
jgi:two-component system sensor kinase FixL